MAKSVKKPAKSAVAIKKSPAKNSPGATSSRSTPSRSVPSRASIIAPAVAPGRAVQKNAPVKPTKLAPTKNAPPKNAPLKNAPSKSVPSKIAPSKSVSSKSSKAIPESNGKRIMLEPATPSKSGVMLVAKSKTAPMPTKLAKAVKKIDPNAPRFPENLPVPQAPVPTDGKPRKNQAGLMSRELEHYRELLLAKRRELVGDMSSMEREALRTSSTNLSNLPLHMADMGTDNYEQEFTLGLVEKDRNLLREINTALAKIQNGTYGICEGTGKPINKPRLEAQPWARFSIEHARMLERGGMGIRRP